MKIVKNKKSAYRSLCKSDAVRCSPQSSRHKFKDDSLKRRTSGMRKVFGGSIIKIWFERQPIFATKVKTQHFSALFVTIVWLVVMRCWRWRPPGVVIFQLIDRLVQFGTRINCRPLRTNLLSLTLASASANFCFGVAFFFFRPLQANLSSNHFAIISEPLSSFLSAQTGRH